MVHVCEFMYPGYTLSYLQYLRYMYFLPLREKDDLMMSYYYCL